METNWKLIVKYMACRDCLRANKKNKNKKISLRNYSRFFPFHEKVRKTGVVFIAAAGGCQVK